MMDVATITELHRITDFSLREIMEYSYDNDKWYKHKISPLKKAPPPGTKGTCGVCIEEAVYMCEGGLYNNQVEIYGLWKMRRVQQTLEWSIILSWSALRVGISEELMDI